MVRDRGKHDCEGHIRYPPRLESSRLAGWPRRSTLEVAATVLRWHVDAGADWALDDAPHDRFAESRQAALSRGEAERGERRARDDRRGPASGGEAARPMAADGASFGAACSSFRARAAATRGAGRTARGGGDGARSRRVGANARRAACRARRLRRLCLESDRDAPRLRGRQSRRRADACRRSARRR